jgi:hypothetical protein
MDDYYTRAKGNRTGIRDQNMVPDTGPDPMRDVPLVLMSVVAVIQDSTFLASSSSGVSSLQRLKLKCRFNFKLPCWARSHFSLRDNTRMTCSFLASLETSESRRILKFPGFQLMLPPRSCCVIALRAKTETRASTSSWGLIRRSKEK